MSVWLFSFTASLTFPTHKALLGQFFRLRIFRFIFNILINLFDFSVNDDDPLSHCVRFYKATMRTKITFLIFFQINPSLYKSRFNNIFHFILIHTKNISINLLKEMIINFTESILSPLAPAKLVRRSWLWCGFTHKPYTKTRYISLLPTCFQ